MAATLGAVLGLREGIVRYRAAMLIAAARIVYRGKLLHRLFASL